MTGRSASSSSTPNGWRRTRCPIPTSPPDMRAAVIHTLGQPPAYAEHPDPTPGAGQSLVRVTAAPIVPLDQLCATGTSYFGAPTTPYVPGVQGVGVVVQSDRLPPGTAVWFATSAGMSP